MTSKQFITIVQSKGSDAEDVRDAAHEATHGVQSKLKKPWTRDNLHAALESLAEREKSQAFRKRDVMLIRYELQARAVEMLACERFRIEYDISHWALMCWMETAKAYRIDIGSVDELADGIKRMAKMLPTRMLFDQVMKLRPSRRP